MLKRLFLFQTWSIAVTATAAISGIPYGALKNVVVFRQYTTSIPMTAGVSTFPRYCMIGGMAFPFGKTRNGTTLVAKVVAATTKIIKIERPALTGILHSPSPPDYFLKEAIQG